MFKGKRGGISDEVWNIILTLLLAVFIFLVMFRFVYSSSIAEQFRLNYIAADVALTLDTLQAVPVDISVSYPQDTSDLGFDFSSSGKVVVFISKNYNPLLSMNGVGWFKKSADYGITTLTADEILIPKKEGKMMLEFSKKGSSILIRNALDQQTAAQSQAQTQRLSCSGIDTSEEQPRAVFIDVDHTNGLLDTLASSIRAACAIQPSVNCGADSELAPLTLTIRLGSEEREASVAVASGSEKSAKAGCLILNSLNERGYEILPVQADSSVSGDKSAAALTLPQAGSPSLSSPAEMARAAQAIADGLREYYHGAKKKGEGG